MVEAKPKQKYTMSPAALKVRQTATLKTGVSSPDFKAFLKREIGYDPLEEVRKLEIKDIDDIKKKLELIDIASKKTEIYLQMYKSVGRRGLTLYDQLADINVKLLEREKRLKDEGKDLLEDEAYMDAKKLQFEFIKYLDKIKWDKEKFEIEQKVKSMDKNEMDDLFTVEAVYEEKHKGEIVDSDTKEEKEVGMEESSTDSSEERAAKGQP